MDNNEITQPPTSPLLPEDGGLSPQGNLPWFMQPRGSRDRMSIYLHEQKKWRLAEILPAATTGLAILVMFIVFFVVKELQQAIGKMPPQVKVETVEKVVYKPEPCPKCSAAPPTVRYDEGNTMLRVFKEDGKTACCIQVPDAGCVDLGTEECTLMVRKLVDGSSHE